MNQNYNFVQGLFSQVMNGKNQALATKNSTSFKGFLLMIVFALFANMSVQGQSTANYAFSTLQNQSLVDMSSGTTQLISGSSDDVASSIVNIGFPFHFMGTGYSQFSVNSNGQMRLGSTAVSGTSQSVAANVPLIVPMSGDNYTLSTGKVHYKIIGTSPNQVLVVEWLDLRIPYSTSGTGSVCQALIYQTTGVIEFIYGSVSNNTSTTTSRSIFISSSNIANTVKSVSDGMITASDGLAPTAITLTDANIALISSVSNTGRRMYRFTPTLSPASGPTSLTCTAATFNSMTLNWNAASDLTNVYRYVVLNSTNGGTSFNVAANIATGTNTYAATGLTPGTTYIWKVVAISEGIESTATTATQATVSGTTYYWVGTTGGLFGAPANWNTIADGTGTTRVVPDASDIFIVDGDGIVPGSGGTTTISGDVASFSLGQFKVTSNTNLTLQSNGTTTRTLTVTGGPGDDFVIEAGSTLSLNHAANAVAFAFSGTGNTGLIAGTVNLTGSASNTINTTGGTGTLVTVASTGIVNMGNTTISLVGTAATLSFLNGSNCNVSGATTGAPPVPLATWETTSNLTISGITTSTTAPTNRLQSFGNLIYNCPAATGTMSFFTTSTTAVIKGDLIITAAGATGGTGIFRALTSGTLTVNGNVIVTQGRFQSANGTGTLIVNGNTTCGTNGIIDINAGTYSQRGTIFTNNGTLTGVASTATLQFFSPNNIAQTLAGSGTVLTNLGVLSVQNTSGLTISHTNQVTVLRANLFQGLITNSNKITFGTGLTLNTTIQIGAAGLLTPGGSLDVAPTFNLGTGTHNLIYAQESVPRTTGFEIPSTRAIGSLTLSNSNGLTIAGGPLATGTLTFSALSGGNINTTSANLLTVTGTTTGSIVRTLATAYVNGPLALTLPVSLATGSTYTFPIGKGTLNPLALVNPMTGATVGATVTVQAEVFDAPTGGTPGTLMGSLNPNRYWTASITSGASNFTDTLIQLFDTTNALDAIASSSTLTGAYNLVGGVSTTTTATSLTSTAPKLTTLPGFFVMGNKAAATLTNLAITPTGNACTNVTRTITVTATPGGGAVTGVVINYSINGVAQTAIPMTNTSGNDWSGVIPTVTPVNAAIVWSVTATDTNSLTKTATGTPYQDAPTFGVTATSSASLTTVCSTSPSILTATITKPGTVAFGAGGTSSSSTGASFFPGAWGGAKTQYIVRASELIAAGIAAGPITSLGFEPTTAGQTYTGFSVSMASTSLSAMTSTFVTTGLSQVYLGTLTNNGFLPVANTVNTLAFGTGSGSASSFVWDGTSNILISISWSSVPNAATSTGSTMKVDAPGFTCSAYRQADNESPATMLASTAATTASSRPRFTFGAVVATIPTSYSWSDGTTVVGTTNPLTVNPAGTSTYTMTAIIGGCSISANPVTITTLPLPSAPTAVGSTQCGTIVPTASVTATSGAAGTGTFKWYTAATGGTALQSSTSTTYTTAVATTTTFYVSEVGVNGCESVRTPVTVNVIAPPTLTLSSSAEAFCVGLSTVTPVTITSSLANYDSYSWSPATNVSGTSTSGYTFNPASTTTYVMSASNSTTGCATTANVVVTVNPLPLITSATSSSEPLCLGNSTTLTGVSIPATAGTAAVGAGATTSSTYSNPFYSAWSNNHTQHLITAAELTAMGIVAGNITSVGLNVTNAGTLPMLNMSLKIGHANTTALAGFANNAQFQTVFTSASYLPVVGVNTLTFTSPFLWDGISNIVLEFCHGNSSSTSTMSRTVSADTTPYVSTVKTHVSGGTSGTTICGDVTTNLSTYSVRPRFIFGAQVGVNLTSTANWTWSPSTALSATTGSSVTANPTVTTVYTVTATNPTTTCTASRPVTVTVLPLPSAPTATNATQCGAQLSTASVTSTTGLTNPVFVWYAAATGGTALQTGTSSTFLTSINSTRTMYVSEYNGTCESLRTPVVMTVTAPPAVTITSSVPSFCGTGGNATLTASSPDSAMTYTWTSINPSATLSSTNTAVTTATISETSDFKVVGIASNPSCLPIESFISIGVYPLPSATVTTTAQGVCPGTSATIGSGLSAGNFTVTCLPAPSAPAVAPLGAVSLVGGQALITPYPAGVTANSTSLDDNFWSGIPVGFNFNFFGSIVTNVFIGSNGTINLGTTGSTQYTFTGGFPSTGNPASTVAVVARDLHWGTAGAGKITYWTEGIAPNRRFVVQFLNGNTYSGGGKQTAEAVFYETLGTIDIRVFEASVTNEKYIGLQDATRTIGATAPNCDVTPVVDNYWNGQTATILPTAPKAWRFTPPSNYNTSWFANNVIIPPAGFANPGVNVFNLSVAPTVTTTYSITYTNQTTGCSNSPGSAQVLMTVLGNTIPAGLITNASATTICTGQTVNFSTNFTGITDGLVFQWQSSIDNGTTWVDIASANAATFSTIPAEPTQYRCKLVACNGVPGYTSAVTIGFNNSVVSTTPGLRCGTGTATAGATGSAGTTIKWYANATGGSALGTGTTFTTPSINSTTTYYAAAETYVAGALPVGAGGTNSATSGRSFLPGAWGGSKTQYIIKASELLAAGIGAGNITSLGFEPTNSGQTYQGFFVSLAPVTANVMTTTFISAGLVQVYAGTETDNGFTPVANTLNNLTFGTGTGSASSFNWDGSSNILVSISRSAVPGAFTSSSTTMKVDDVGFVSTAYDLADNLTPAAMLASATADGTTSFRPRFTINGQVVCSSVRVPVVVTVTTPPAITLSGDPAVICAESNTAPVTVTAGASNYDSYVWSPTSVTGNVNTGWVFNPLTTTTYTLAASQTTGATPCATTATITVNVNPTPSVLTVSPSPVSACANIILPLVSSGGTLDNMTLLTQNFNGPNNWTTVNNSTGGSAGPALADWTLQQSGYVYSFYGPFVSNDNSQFYMSNSDAQGSGGTTSTELKSPVFSTIGYSVANLSFYHYLYFPTTAKVEYTTNGGATWTTIQTYTTTQGAIAAFANANLSLPAAMLNQPSVQLRFKYDDSWGYFWAIDNVSISGTQVAPMVWSPTTNLYTDAAATIPYTGQNLSTVYFKNTSPASSVTYTATATSLLGCARVATVPVTVYQTAAPTGLQFYQFCPTGGATVTSMTSAITGSNIKWYSTSTGGTALAPTTPLTQGYYWASQTLNGCESPTRFLVFAISNATAAPSSSPTQQFCNSATVANLTANGSSLQWYSTATGGTPLASTTALSTGTYYVSQTSGGCESPRTAVSVTVTTVPAPTGAATQSLSSLLTLGDIVVTGSNITWYASAANAASGTNPLPSTQLLANTTYYATQTINGCRSATSLAVTITTLANQDFDMTQFTYYPNPVIDLLNITYSQDMTSVKVFNMIGQQLMNKQVNSNTVQIDMSSYPNGAYFIQVTTENAMKTVRVIKK